MMSLGSYAAARIRPFCAPIAHTSDGAQLHSSETLLRYFSRRGLHPNEYQPYSFAHMLGDIYAGNLP
jgi:hypothetical protein